MTRRRLAIAAATLALVAVVIGWRVHASVASPAPLVNLPVTGAQLAWTAGSNAKLPKITTRLAAAEATRLATLTNETQPMSDGSYNCPMDDGSAVVVTFDATGRAAQQVPIGLTGCAGPADRFMSEALAAELHKLAPAGYYPRGW